MPFTPEELEAIRQADEALEREWVEDATERAINAEIDKWADEQAMLDLLDKRGRAVWRYKREYREAHKDEIAAYQRKYYEAHKDEIAAYKREYYEANKDEIAAHKREYREAHKDEIAAYQREYRREYRKGRRR